MHGIIEKLIDALDDQTNAFYGSNSYDNFFPVTDSQYQKYLQDLNEINKSNGDLKSEKGGRSKRKEHVAKMFLDTKKATFDLTGITFNTTKDLKLELQKRQRNFLSTIVDRPLNEIIDHIQSLNVKQQRSALRDFASRKGKKGDQRFFETVSKRFESFIKNINLAEVSQVDSVPLCTPLPNHSFLGFEKTAFDILQLYASNPQKEEYTKTKNDFEKHLKTPMSELFEIIGPTQDSIFGPRIETKKRILSQITKNDYGRGGIYSHYWGAFYPTGEKRTNSPQLFVFMHPDGLRFGFAFGNYSDAYIKSFVRKVENTDFNWKSYFHYLDSKGIMLTKEYEDRNESAKSEKAVFKNYKDMLLKDEANPFLAVHLSIQDVVKHGKSLPDLIASTFHALSPLFAVASFDDFEDYITAWHENSDKGDDLENLLEEGESLPTAPVSVEDNWEDFLLEMNWTKSMPESIALESLFEQAIDSSSEDISGFQTILVGPPGTGKSKAAQELALSVATSEKHIHKIQFHQSYSYEHFIEGIKPTTLAGNLSYEVVSGPFVKFCKLAKQRPNDHFVMIIDEINRGNLSKIFGELLYLLEYREESLPLMYSGAKFSIPKNLSIVGTMNSADRSIALVDFAMRRRFKFVEIAPRAEILKKFYDSSEQEHKFSIEFFKRLNEKIGIPNLSVGHSYFLNNKLRHEGLSKKEMEKIYNDSIYPLLQEYFGSSQRMDEFPKTFSKIWDELLQPQLVSESEVAEDSQTEELELGKTGTD